MNFEQVRPKKGSEIVLEQIKSRIESGELPPGTKLSSVVDLAASFGVGRSTIREALSGLKAMGWLDIQQGGGTYVSKELPKERSSAADLYQSEPFREVLEMRKFIETGCASLAAARRTDDDVEELERILRTMSETIGDEALGEQADIAFHLQIARCARNSLLLQTMESLHQRLQDSMKESRRLWFFGERASAQRLLAEHTAIFAAIKRQDEAQAAQLMAQHIDKVDSVLRQLL
ncbi:FadR/GntR family transcriptional regulator [Paenibacillus thalictri]|uniref:FadR family transcriptional regulator n=1 Tax=Paenibacillus thalictri TaxID=2527873 RepID=A0A4Q9DW64_9BACL|nr:FadR/GntR family transcriptional regulator [Paenibacillus thalictri]TBL79958.1 FadR family transcriptional regulator [Paenibacillus thalictri]